MRDAPGPSRRGVVTGAAASGVAAWLPARSDASGAPATFEVSGPELRWGAAPVRLTGVAVGDPLYIRKDRPTSDYGVIAADWRANVVRISLHPGHWRASPGPALERLGREVAAARAAGLFVILDWHVIGFPGLYRAPVDPSWGLPPDAYDPDLVLAAAFWSEAARSFGRDPGVIFELWNEPVADPRLWVSTGQHWPMLKQTWLRLFEVIRRHSEAVVLASGGRWANDLVGVARDPIDDPRVAYAWHCYPREAREAPGGWAASLDGLPCSRPVVATEWGFCSDCVPDLRGSADDFGVPFARDVLDRLGLHSTAWSWSAGATPAMLQPDWRTPNAYGRFVRGYLAHAGAPAPPSCGRPPARDPSP